PADPSPAEPVVQQGVPKRPAVESPPPQPAEDEAGATRRKTEAASRQKEVEAEARRIKYEQTKLARHLLTIPPLERNQLASTARKINWGDFNFLPVDDDMLIKHWPVLNSPKSRAFVAKLAAKRGFTELCDNLDIPTRSRTDDLAREYYLLPHVKSSPGREV